MPLSPYELFKKDFAKMMKHTTKQTGNQGEDYAAEYLIKKHYKILERNYRKRTGEIDIIAEKKGVVVFVEVKTRHSTTLSQPFEAVDRRKQDKIIQTAIIYLYEKKLECDCRFDVCEVFVNQDTLRLHKIHYIENAFIMEESHGYF